MQRSRSALVVAATPSLATQLCAWLKLSGWHVITTSTYPAAKTLLDRGADLLVTELELEDYNGLQLALRAQAEHIPALVIGRADAVLERDAEQLGCVYLRKDDVDSHRLVVAVEAKIEGMKGVVPAISRNLEFARRPLLSLRPGVTSRRMLLH